MTMSRQILSESLKQKLKAGVRTIGSWVSLGHPAVAEIMANAGFDWIVVDLEHSTISIEQAGELIRIIDLAGAVPLVRLTSNDNNQIKRVMDAGALGIIVPMVNSVEDAKTAIAATQYAPQGNRGVGLARAQKYGAGFYEYLKWQREETVVIVQIEHVSAIEQLDKILAIPDVDGFIVGPYDLSCSMGIPGEFEHPDFVKIMKLIKEQGEMSGKPGGLHIVEPDKEKLQQAIIEGYLFIAYSVDIRILDSVCREGLNSVRGA